MNTASESVVSRIVREIESPNEEWLIRARAHLSVLTKPLGSLGLLEDIAAQMVSIRQEDFAKPLCKAVWVFAADHGVTAEGVSAYPNDVTHQMVLNFLEGGAAVNVLARLHCVAMSVVDVGVDADFGPMSGLLDYKVRRGTRNMLREAAMNDAEMASALEVGTKLADEAKKKGQSLLAVGEMGIGNTTAASAITAALTGTPAAKVTGRGTGLDEIARTHKQRVIEGAIERHCASGHLGPLDILRCLGGLEIAAMTGLFLAAAQHRIALIADGFISTAAAALAFAIEPRVREYLFAGHQSEEPGHRILLEFIGLKPILSLNMRLGEGTGAVLAMPIIESALALYIQMATFASAGVSEAMR
jgi:nicotinate-nucleotide--dimethylbenzimidazole phosphoribosyltransferase